MLHFVQGGNTNTIQRWKKEAEEWEGKVKRNEEHLKKLESVKKKRELIEGEL